MDGIFLSQYKYAKDLIDMACMIDTKTFDPLIELSVKYNKNSGESVSDPILYSTLVGCLIYLTTTRSDISYAVQIVGQFMSDFTSSSLEYCSLHGSLSTWHFQHGLFFSKDSCLQLIAYTDTDQARYLETR